MKMMTTMIMISTKITRSYACFVWITLHEVTRHIFDDLWQSCRVVAQHSIYSRFTTSKPVSVYTLRRAEEWLKIWRRDESRKWNITAAPKNSVKSVDVARIFAVGEVHSILTSNPDHFFQSSVYSLYTKYYFGGGAPQKLRGCIFS